MYDVVLPTPIPGKGAILTQLSLWWFEQLADVVPNHVISATDVPAGVGRPRRPLPPAVDGAGRVHRPRLPGRLGAGRVPGDGRRAGDRCREGLVEGSRLPEPIFTPSTKEPAERRHDAPSTYAEVGRCSGADDAGRLRRLTLEVYRRGAELAAARGVVIADTKLEFGRAAAGDAGARRRAPDPGLVAVLARRGLAARPRAVRLRQAVRARLGGVHRLGPDRARAATCRTTSSPSTRERYVAAYERITGRALVLRGQTGARQRPPKPTRRVSGAPIST